MHILIIEAALTGHHSGYLERIATSFLQANHYVSISVLKSDIKHEALERLSNKFDGKIRLMPIDSARYQAALKSRLGEPGRELALRGVFGRVYRAVQRIERVDYVFIPYLDYCLYAFGLLGSPFGDTRWGGICMRPSFHYKRFGVIAPIPRFSNIKRRLFLRVLEIKTLRSVYAIDELLPRFISEVHPDLCGRLQHVAEPAELNGIHTRASAREALGIAEEAIVVLVYGAINERKGLDALIEASNSPAIPASLSILVVGRQSKGIEALLKSQAARKLVNTGRCCVINSFVDDSVEQMAFAATDIVWLGYRGHYTMSGVLALAIKFRKKVIATQDGLIGWYVKRYARGVAVDIDNSDQVTNGLLSVATGWHARSDDMDMSSIIGCSDWSSLLSKISIK